jgi:hypothetical protein|tara:strand:- start:244 stop:663 length:420 start_codon:yes stop_codon:yes gene_type:complete
MFVLVLLIAGVDLELTCVDTGGGQYPLHGATSVTLVGQTRNGLVEIPLPIHRGHVQLPPIPWQFTRWGLNYDYAEITELKKRIDELGLDLPGVRSYSKKSYWQEKRRKEVAERAYRKGTKADDKTGSFYPGNRNNRGTK